jgi:N-acetylmuramoyl-L-alanine amidase
MIYRACILIVFSLFIVSSALSFFDTDEYQDSLWLNVVIPDADTVDIDVPRYRIAANTHPDASAFINDRQVKVYPSGAFVGLIELKRGENEVTISAGFPSGERLTERFTLIRPELPTTSPVEPLVIESHTMQPSQDYWLHNDDILEVRFKGSPGFEASFDIEGVAADIPMRELPPAQTGGIGGIYTGHYVAQKGDYVSDIPVRFRLRNDDEEIIETESPGLVSIMADRLPFIAEAQGSRPFFNVGLGTDRLGGARLGFIQPGVLLQIDGKVGQMYRVRLSDDMTAWVQSRFINILSSETPPPRAMAGSISSAGSPAADVVSLQLGKKLPYLTQQLINPNRIVVDIYGVTSNTTWVTHHLSAEGIRNITWEQVSTDQYRLQIELNHPLHWGYRIEYNEFGNMYVIIRRPPVLTDLENILQGRIIAIDAGHGGTNNGALGSTGAKEKDITLAISKNIEEILIEHGASVIMTRTDDYDVSMANRVEKVLSGDPDILVSIHANSIGYGTDPERVLGTSMYYKYIGFKPLADIMYQKLLDLGFGEFGVVGSFNFTLNDMLEFPNVLVETAFMSHPEDEMLLLDVEMQKMIASAVVEGLESYLKLNKSNVFN